jgi:hypothetical protein
VSLPPSFHSGQGRFAEGSPSRAAKITGLNPNRLSLFVVGGEVSYREAQLVESRRWRD